MSGISEQQRGDLDKTLKNLNLTNQEVDKFSKAFKDPEFIKLFEDYAREVSDPKNKEETEAYLRQLEAEGRGEDVYGKGVQLIVPTEAFVLKTKDTKKGTKVFINVCTSEKVAKMKTTVGKDAKGNAAKGTYVEMPLTLSHKKDGKDNKGEPALVWDFVVHPDTLSATRTSPQLHSMLLDTAMENIERANPGFKLSRQAKVLKVSYKGVEGAPKPHVLTVRVQDAAANPDGSSPKPTSVDGRIKPQPNAPCVPGLVPDGSTAAGAPQGESDTRSTFKFPAGKPKDAKAAPEAPTQPHQPGYRHDSGEITPQWEVVHRGQIDLSEAWGDAGRGLALSGTYPDALVVRVSLPGVSSAAGVELDVGPLHINVSVPGRYKLEASLPYRVNDSKGKAKFDKAKSSLEITLPTIPPPPPTAAPLAVAHASSVEEISSSSEGQGEVRGQEDVQAVGQEQAAGAGAGSTSTQQAEEVVQDEASSPATGTSDLGGDMGNELTENQRKWAELHAAQEAAQAVAAAAAEQEAASDSNTTAAAAPPQGGASQPGEPFIPSDSFAGARPGYVFKLGPEGLGYYPDVRPVHTSSQPTAVSKPDAASSALAALAAAGIKGPDGVAHVAPAAPQQPAAVKLQPRLTRSLADDLD